MPLRFSSHLPVGAVLVATVLTGCEDGRGTQAAAGACGAGSSAPDGEATAPVTDAGTLTPWAGPSAAGSDGPSRASEGGLAADSSARSPHGQGTSDGAALDASGADAAGPDTTTVGASADAGGALPRFSFFVTSQAAVLRLAAGAGRGNLGFGGDLRFGETGAGAGLRGADKICATIAESSMPGAGAKGWHAFLSTTAENARDRIGTGPWYDRLGRVVALDLGSLLSPRPLGAAPDIAADLPSETGAPNHNPDGRGNVDNHDTLTASNERGTYDHSATCNDWTSTAVAGSTGPTLGHSWPRSGSAGGSASHWITAHQSNGCGPSVNTVDNGAGVSAGGVGDGGGYGGIYCFATTP
jgi:hypothetical protein